MRDLNATAPQKNIKKQDIMKKKDIEKLLSSHSSIILIMPEDEKEGEYNRDIGFIVRGTRYRIQWWKNICYLYIGELQIPFYAIEISGTWPNNFKKNIQFLGSGGKVVAILPVEKY